MNLLPALLLMGMSAAIGCGASGPERFAVSGQVTFDGAPLADGEIVFTPDKTTAGPTAADRIENGAYDIAAEHGPVAGGYSIAITAERPSGRKVRADIIGDATVDQLEQYVPPEYNARTTLRADFSADRDDLNFELLSKPK
jgi:hypothetical protein